jgi:uncharacterized membrane protein
MNLPLLKYRNMINNIRDWRFEQLALTTTIFSMLLTIIAIMNISSYFGKFMAEHNTMVIFSLVVLVLFFQMAIFGIIRSTSSLQQQQQQCLDLIHFAAFKYNIKYKSEPYFIYSRVHHFYLM